jgi:hypothetical protein
MNASSSSSLTKEELERKQLELSNERATIEIKKLKEDLEHESWLERKQLQLINERATIEIEKLKEDSEHEKWRRVNEKNSIGIFLKRQLLAICLSAGVFLLGIILAVAINTFHIGDSAVFIALLLTPLLVYGIASGKIQEFGTPGGWSAKFHEIANAPVVDIPLSQSVQRLEFVEKETPERLSALIAGLKPNVPIALTFQLGKGYDLENAKNYVRTLLLLDNEMAVIIQDDDTKYVAMTEGMTLLLLLNVPVVAEARKFLDAISGKDKSFFNRTNGFHHSSVQKTDTNSEALKLMRDENQGQIVVVDDKTHVVGVVKRNDIVARLVEKLAISGK